MIPHKISTSDTRIDAAKGILILLIVLGHNDYFFHDYTAAYRALYSFHVMGFFMLSGMLAKPRQVDAAFVRDRIVRYLVPFTAFFLFYAAIYTIIETPDITMSEWFKRTVLGYFVNSSVLLDESCGFKRMWFLPALLSFVLLLALLPKRKDVLVLLVILHGLVGMSPVWLKTYAPFGLLITLHMLPLAIFARYIWQRYPDRFTPCMGVLFALAWLMLATWAAELNGYVTLADMDVYGWNQPGMLLLYDTLALLGFFAVFSIATLVGKWRLLVWIGQVSLVIYLVHGLVSHGLKKVGLPDGMAGLLISYFATVLLSILAAFMVEKLPALKRLVFPRDYASWKLALQRKQPA